MGVERLIPRVADKRPRDGRQVHAAVPRENKIRNENVGEARAIEVIAELHTGVTPATDDPLDLE